MWDPAFCELYAKRPQLATETRKMSEKYHNRLNKIFKRYYHTAIRKLIVIFATILLAYVITDDILHYQPSKTVMILIASIIFITTAIILIYPLVRLHKIKQRKFNWYIGKQTTPCVPAPKCIFVDYEKSTPINKRDTQFNNEQDIYMLIWIKNKKYAINTHATNMSELVA